MTLTKGMTIVPGLLAAGWLVERVKTAEYHLYQVGPNRTLGDMAGKKGQAVLLTTTWFCSRVGIIDCVKTKGKGPLPLFEADKQSIPLGVMKAATVAMGAARIDRTYGWVGRPRALLFNYRVNTPESRSDADAYVSLKRTVPIASMPRYDDRVYEITFSSYARGTGNLLLTEAARAGVGSHAAMDMVLQA